MSSSVESGFESRGETAGVVAACVVLVVPVVAQLNGFFYPDHGATKEFYAAAAGVIPALLIPLALQLRAFLELIGRWTIVDHFAVLIIFGNIAFMVVGEASALHGLNCTGVRCGSAATQSDVVQGLISATALVLGTVILSFAAALSKSESSRHRRP